MRAPMAAPACLHLLWSPPKLPAPLRASPPPIDALVEHASRGETTSKALPGLYHSRRPLHALRTPCTARGCRQPRSSWYACASWRASTPQTSWRLPAAAHAGLLLPSTLGECACTRAHMHAQAHALTQAHTHTRTRTHARSKRACTHMYTHTHTQTCARTHTTYHTCARALPAQLAECMRIEWAVSHKEHRCATPGAKYGCAAMSVRPHTPEVW